jgi:CHAD domain-containing protein
VRAAAPHTASRRARPGAPHARRAPTPDAFHEWRKSAKHLWHQTQLLQGAAPATLPHQAHAFHHLADALGDDHDLAALTRLLQEDPDAFGGGEAVGAAIAVIEARRADLEQASLDLGAQLLVEKPKAFVARMTGLWQRWSDA